MAQRRMFNKSITNSSNFLMMPQSAQNLYFHFGMNADDDGFCEHFTIMRMTESKPDDLKILQAKGFIHIFDDRVLIITDWKENNYIQKDRYTPSRYLQIYKKEIKLLSEGSCKNGVCIQNVSNLSTQVRLGKDSIGKDNIETAANAATSAKKKWKDNNSMTLKEFVYWTDLSPQRHIKLIGQYADEKKLAFINHGQWKAFVNRNVRSARQLANFTDEQIAKAFSKIKNAHYVSEWTIETILKFLEH